MAKNQVVMRTLGHISIIAIDICPKVECRKALGNDYRSNCCQHYGVICSERTPSDIAGGGFNINEFEFPRQAGI